MVHVKVVGANVRNNPVMKRWQVLADFTKIENWADVALLNEIGRGWYRRLLRTVFMLQHWIVVGLHRSETPICLRRDTWKVLERQVHVLHEGLAKTSPVRRIVVVVAEHRHNGAVVAWATTHFVSGAWNWKAKVHKAWRRVKWLLGYDKAVDVIGDLQARGISGVLFGDLNRVNVRPLTDRFVWVKGQRNIVKMGVWVAPGGASIAAEDVLMDHDVETDHPMIRARLEIVA